MAVVLESLFKSEIWPGAAYPVLRPDFLQLLPWCSRGRRASDRRNPVAKLPRRVVDGTEAQAKDYFIGDDKPAGFGLRVFKSGKRSYLI